MKRFFSCICLFFFLAGCSSVGKVITKEDSFKNALTVTMEHTYSSVETKGFLQGSTQVWCNYYREIKETQKAPAEITFKIQADGREEDLKKEAYVKVANESFKIALSDMKTEVKSATRYRTKSTTKNKNTLVIDAGLEKDDESEIVTETKATTLHWKEYKGTLVLPLPIEQKISGSDNLAFRLYMGSKPLTFEVKDKKLVQVKTFLATTEKKE